MRVQIVGHESPRSISVRADQAVDILQEVFLRSRLANQRRENLTGRDMEISKQPKCSMANVLIFPTCDSTAPWKKVSGDALECLDSSLFINGDRVDTVSEVQVNCIAVRLANFENLGVPSFPVINFWKQPILVSVRLNVGLILKKPRLVKQRSSVRFHA